MVAKNKKTSEKKKTKGRVKPQQTAKDLSAAKKKKVKGGKAAADPTTGVVYAKK